MASFVIFSGAGAVLRVLDGRGQFHAQRWREGEKEARNLKRKENKNVK